MCVTNYTNYMASDDGIASAGFSMRAYTYMFGKAAIIVSLCYGPKSLFLLNRQKIQEKMQKR